jgi:tRNA1(Val) A37 N6-methylase TrmN6
MCPPTQGLEIQQESRPAKSPIAGELTGSSGIKLPKRLIIHKWEGHYTTKMDYKLMSTPGLLKSYYAFF